MVESLDICSTMLHQLLGVLTASLQMFWVDLEQKTRSSRSPRKQQAPFKLPKRSSTGTAKSLCGIENHCKVCLTSTLRTLSSRKTKLTTPEEHCCVLCL
ncbi:uncharacterized protein LOC142814766 isoform X2 [Rhipicephalus microplus]|uniref:uncharacterized protein LOC142814766 isoform X2 n=1 Tax=Rhipicephalus microplus TaxID=6941 RepID=UPI003F6C07D0